MKQSEQLPDCRVRSATKGACYGNQEAERWHARHDGSVATLGGPPATKPSGYLPAKDNPERDRDAHGENLNDPKVRKVSDAFKTKKNR